MIGQYEATRLLIENIDELANQQYPSQPSMAIYTTIKHFTDYMKKALAAHNTEQVNKCFALAGNLYLHGDKTVRTLIEDSFICSVSSVMSPHRTDWVFLKSTAPATLYQVYKKHLLTQE